MTDEKPRLYHGTRRHFTKGGILIPPAAHGRPVNWEIGDPEFIYMTDDLATAWFFAFMCDGRGKPKVLQVEPTEVIEVDDATVGGEEARMYRSRGWAHVVGVLTCEHKNIYFGPQAEVCCHDCGRTVEEHEVPREGTGWIDPFTGQRVAGGQ